VRRHDAITAQALFSAQQGFVASDDAAIKREPLAGQDIELVRRGADRLRPHLGQGTPRSLIVLRSAASTGFGVATGAWGMQWTCGAWASRELGFMLTAGIPGGLAGTSTISFGSSGDESDPGAPPSRARRGRRKSHYFI
jgi:hypothetical protein